MKRPSISNLRLTTDRTTNSKTQRQPATAETIEFHASNRPAEEELNPDDVQPPIWDKEAFLKRLDPDERECYLHMNEIWEIEDKLANEHLRLVERLELESKLYALQNPSMPPETDVCINEETLVSRELAPHLRRLREEFRAGKTEFKTIWDVIRHIEANRSKFSATTKSEEQARVESFLEPKRQRKLLSNLRTNLRPKTYHS